MRIDVNQRKFAIGEKYDIFIDGQGSYKASSRLLRIPRAIDLYTTDGDQPLLTIKKRWSFIIKKYDIVRGGDIYRFRIVKFWKRQALCVVGRDTYDIYGHKGLKYSIYKNDRQVAWWDQARVSWFDGDNYAMNADKDSDRELLIAFILIVDDASSRNQKGNTVTLRLGHIGPEARPFNPSWTPKD